eukprot:scaffold30011_cov23-Cyclotella_meneghiniana.AAC.2
MPRHTPECGGCGGRAHSPHPSLASHTNANLLPLAHRHTMWQPRPPSRLPIKASATSKGGLKSHKSWGLRITFQITKELYFSGSNMPGRCIQLLLRPPPLMHIRQQTFFLYTTADVRSISTCPICQSNMDAVTIPKPPTHHHQKRNANATTLK